MIDKKESMQKHVSSVTIDGVKVGIGCPVYVVAEISANHMQSLDRAKDLLWAAKNAGANAVNNSEQGRITGYQAGAVMWEFIREFLYTSNKTGLKITNYDNFLFPQYGYKFDRTIAADNWKELQKAAAENMIESEAAHEKYLKQLDQYQIDLAAFVAKYPDYYERKEHYDHLSVGTNEERSAYYEKLDSGFEFAPQKPSSSAAATAVYAHWRKIVDGIVPFGFRVAE